MADYEFFNPENVGYSIPDEILNGDFRKQEGEPDPDFPYAAQLVANNVETPTQDMIEDVYLEISRLRRTFDDISAHGDTISLDAYWYARDFYMARISAILRGETELPER